MLFLLSSDQQAVPLHKALPAKQAVLRAVCLRNGTLGESQVSKAQAGYTVPCCELGRRKSIV